MLVLEHLPGFMSLGSTAGTMRALGMMVARMLPRAAWILQRGGKIQSCLGPAEKAQLPPARGCYLQGVPGVLRNQPF